MPILRTLVASFVMLGLCLLTAMTSGCATTAPAAERAPASANHYNAVPVPTADAPPSPAQDALIPGQPGHGEELWVIARDPQAAKPAVADAAHAFTDIPGTGSLLARLPDQTAPIPVPLKQTDVKSEIQSYIATVNVTQQYANPFKVTIEAIYVFPLPRNAAVSEFIMTIGERKIRGIIRERAEAERIYQAAKAQGYVASLLIQDRPSAFTQSVANIEPGKQIDINIKYVHQLDYADGWYEFHFPMVMKSKVTPEQRSGRDISLKLHLDAGVKIEQLEIPNHRVDLHRESTSATAILTPDDSIPNRDFVCRYRVAGGQLKSDSLAGRSTTGIITPTSGFISIDATRRTTTQPK